MISSQTNTLLVCVITTLGYSRNHQTLLTTNIEIEKHVEVLTMQVDLTIVSDSNSEGFSCRVYETLSIA